jgi:hypothetical protein
MRAATIAALRQFQSDQGLPVTGHLDSSTLDALNAPSEMEEWNEEYRILTPEDSFSCVFSQELSTSMLDSAHSSLTANNHFDCTDKGGKKVSIDLWSVKPSGGMIEIKTKKFGTVLKGNEMGTFDRYEMKESQIKKLRTFLGF